MREFTVTLHMCDEDYEALELWRPEFCAEELPAIVCWVAQDEDRVYMKLAIPSSAGSCDNPFTRSL